MAFEVFSAEWHREHLICGLPLALGPRFGLVAELETEWACSTRDSSGALGVRGDSQAILHFMTALERSVQSLWHRWSNATVSIGAMSQ